VTSATRGRHAWIGIGLVATAVLSPPPSIYAQDLSKPADARKLPEGLKFANALLKDRRYDLAADQYERFLKAGPTGLDEADARFGLGRARLFLNDYPAARRELEAFLKRAPEHPNAPTARFRVGEAAYLMNDMPAARAALEIYTSTYPDGAHRDTAWPELADACVRLNDLPAARAAYLKAIEVEPKGRLANRSRYHLGRTLASLGETDDAVKVLAALADANDPEWSGKARLQEAQVLLATGKAAEAAERFEAIERLKPPGVAPAEARLRRAEALVKLDRREEAEALLVPLVAEGSKTVAPPAAFALAGSLLDRGKAAEALAACDDAIRRAPESPWHPRLLFRSAEALAKTGDVAGARSRFMRVSAEFPKDAWAPSALLRAARLALESADPKSASAIASEFAAKFPTSTLKPDIQVIAARASLALDQPRDAVAALEPLIADATLAPALRQSASYYLGLAYKADGQEQKAAAMLADLAKDPTAPGSADAKLVVGFGQFEAKKFAEAAESFQGYLDARPKGDDAPRALAYLALAKAELGDADAATAALDRLAKEFPKSDALVSARLILAESALEAKRYVEAEGMFQAVAESGDAKVKARALSGLGWARMGANHPEEAASAFASLLAESPADPLATDAALGRARALEMLGKDDEALEGYALVASTYAQSPQAPTALVARARLLGKLGKAADAADALANLLKSPPADAPGVPSVPDLLAEWGYLLHDAGKTGEADSAFRKLLDTHPDSPRAADARVFLAESLHAAGKSDEAAALLEPLGEPSAKADPILIQTALLRLARIDLAKGDAVKAAARFDRLATEFPDGKFLLEAKLGKAESDLNGGRAAEAEAQFAAVAKEATADPKLAATARLRQTQCLAALEKWDEALASADAIRSDMVALTNPQAAELDYVRGRALHAQARFDEARAAFQAAIEAAPGSETAAKCQLMRGETYFHQKNYVEALREFHKTDLTYKAPEWQAAALLEAGKVYMKLDRWSDAADTFEKVRANFPMDPRIEEANTLLAESRKNVNAPPPPLEAAPPDKP